MANFNEKKDNVIAGLKNNRMILIIAGILLAGGLIYSMTRSHQVVANRSDIGSAPKITTGLSGNENQSYRQEIDQNDIKRKEEAKKTGNGFIQTVIPQAVDGNNNSGDNFKPPVESATPNAPNQVPAIPDDIPHIVPPTPVQIQQPVVIRRKKPAIMVDPARIAQYERAITDAARMDSFKPEQVYSSRTILAQEGTQSSSSSSSQSVLNAGNDNAIKEAMNGSSAGNEVQFEIPVAGTILQGHFASEVDSRLPGVVLGVIDSGPYAGARVMGSFQTAGQALKLMVVFREMTVTYRDDNDELHSKVLKVNAYAVDPNTLSQGMATYVNRHLISKIGFQMATSFMQGLGQAISQSGSTALVTPSGGTVISQGNRTLQDQLLQAGGTSAGVIGQTLQNMFGNQPDTIKIGKDTPFGLLFVGNDGN